jgi:hypothetical protein
LTKVLSTKEKKMSKSLYNILMIISAAMIMTACGGGGSTAGSTSINNGSADYKIVPMVIGEKTQIKPGYSIVQANDEAVVEIVVVGSEKSGTLMEGEASLKIPL